MDEKAAHACISTTCIRYLILCAANTSIEGTLPDIKYWTPEHFTKYAQYWDKRPLASYTLCFLNHHMQGWQGDSRVTTMVSQLVNELNGGPIVYLLEEWIYLLQRVTVLRNHKCASAKQFRNELLHVAAREGFSTAVEVLLAVFADASAKDGDGWTPLHWASEIGHEWMAHVLLVYGADVHAKADVGWTPLHFAAERGYESIAGLLLEHGAEVNARDDAGCTPLHFAAERGHDSVVRLLVSVGGDVDEGNWAGWTPLHWVAESGNESVARELLECGAHIEEKNWAGWTPLDWSTLRGHEPMKKLLREKGAQIHIKNSSAFRQLYWPRGSGCGPGHGPGARLMLQKGVEVGWAPLYWAAFGMGHVSRRVNDLYRACQTIAEDLQSVTGNVFIMWLVLQGVWTDLMKNPCSFFHQFTAIASTQKQKLGSLIGQCEKSLKKLEGLLKKQTAFKMKHAAYWEIFRGSVDWRRDVADCCADMMMATSMLDHFLSKEGLSFLWNLEAMVDGVVRNLMMHPAQQIMLNIISTEWSRNSDPKNHRGFGLLTSSVPLLMTTLWRPKDPKKRAKPSNPAPLPKQTQPRRPKTITKVPSGFMPSWRRALLLNDYPEFIANASAQLSPRVPRQRAPSPEPYRLPVSNEFSPSQHTRRSRSTDRLRSRSDLVDEEQKQRLEHYEYWIISLRKSNTGRGTVPRFSMHQRGQIQIRQMGVVFREVDEYAEKAMVLTDRDERVRLLLRKKNAGEKKKGSGRKWKLVAGRVVDGESGEMGKRRGETVMCVLVLR